VLAVRVSPAEWLALKSIYRTWRSDQDDDTLVLGVDGHRYAEWRICTGSCCAGRTTPDGRLSGAILPIGDWIRSGQGITQPAAACGMAQSPECLFFDLPDAFTRQAEFVPDLLQCMVAPILQAKPQAQDTGLARRKGV